MLTRVRLENFKAWREADLSLRQPDIASQGEQP